MTMSPTCPPAAVSPEDIDGNETPPPPPASASLRDNDSHHLTNFIISVSLLFAFFCVSLTIAVNDDVATTTIVDDDATTPPVCA